MLYHRILSQETLLERKKNDNDTEYKCLILYDTTFNKSQYNLCKENDPLIYRLVSFGFFYFVFLTYFHFFFFFLEHPTPSDESPPKAINDLGIIWVINNLAL